MLYQVIAKANNGDSDSPADNDDNPYRNVVCHECKTKTMVKNGKPLGGNTN